MLSSQDKFARIHKISEALEESVRAVLNLRPRDRVFVGNAEKIFVGVVLEAQTLRVRCPSTLRTFNDVFDYLELSQGREASRRRAGAGRGNTHIRLLQSMSHAAAVLGHKLTKPRPRGVVYHFAAHLRPDPRVSPNFTDLAAIPTTKSSSLRQALRRELELRLGEDAPIDMLTDLFPTFYLEGYVSFARSYVPSLNPRIVYSSVYGVMSDPVLAHIIKMSGASLRYVQHGGTYGYSLSWQFVLEEQGCDEMIFWGVGPINVFPTRYRQFTRFAPRHRAHSVAIILSNRSELCDEVTTMRDAIRRAGREVFIYGHPRLPSYVACDFHGIDEFEHCAHGLVVFDSFHHSLIYARLINRRPLMIVDGEELSANHAEGRVFLARLQSKGVISSPAAIVSAVSATARAPEVVADFEDLLPAETLFERDDPQRA